MKKSVLLLLGIFFGLLFVSNVNYKTSNSFVMTMVAKAPTLPEIPFDYSNIELPVHLFFDEDIGYTGGILDETSFDNITDHGATLGRVLFYDRKLSAVENISCGSCHLQELSFTENKAFSEGVNSLTQRNSMQLNDLAWTSSDEFAWSMKELTLHNMIILPLTDENEIGANIDDVKLKLEATNYYPELFEKAYGDSEITEDRIIDALVQFIESMTSFNSKFDDGAKTDFVNFTEEEKLGQSLFSLNCATCHVPPEFSIDPNSLNNAFVRPASNFPGDPSWLDGTRSPTLRDLIKADGETLNGGMFHSGQAIDLKELVHSHHGPARLRKSAISAAAPTC